VALRPTRSFAPGCRRSGRRRNGRRKMIPNQVNRTKEPEQTIASENGDNCCSQAIIQFPPCRAGPAWTPSCSVFGWSELSLCSKRAGRNHSSLESRGHIMGRA
jgi:hypothetical protein